MMHKEGSFPRLVELVQLESVQEDTRLHQMLLELLYESSRVQRLDWEDFGMFRGSSRTPEVSGHQLTYPLAAVNDNVILYLLGIIEGASDDADDPYHYPVIRVLVRTSKPTSSLRLIFCIAGLERTIPGSLHKSPQRRPSPGNKPTYQSIV